MQVVTSIHSWYYRKCHYVSENPRAALQCHGYHTTCLLKWIISSNAHNHRHYNGKESECNVKLCCTNMFAAVPRYLNANDSWTTALPLSTVSLLALSLGMRPEQWDEGGQEVQVPELRGRKRGVLEGKMMMSRRPYSTASYRPAPSTALHYTPTYSSNMAIKKICCQWELFLLYFTAPEKLIYIHIARFSTHSCPGIRKLWR